MCKRHQEKHPAHIVRDQRTEQGYGQGYMRWELGKPFRIQEASLHYTPITPVKDSMSKVKYRRILDADGDGEQTKSSFSGETAKENRERRAEEKRSSKIGSIPFQKERELVV